MAIANEKPNYTFEDYSRLPEGERIELIGGEFLLSPSPRTRHQDVLSEIAFRLRQWVVEKDLGKIYIAPTDVVLSPHDVVQPDILFIARERHSIITEANIQGAPDFVVEILSPGNEAHDTIVKKILYERYGVKEYWIVDPHGHTVSAYDLRSGGYALRKTGGAGEVLESAVVAGFELSLAPVFAP